jgi:hypothetical protein
MLSIGKQLTAEQRLNKATVDIMANPKYVALAGILMIGDRGIKEDIPTACTNGRDEWYGRATVSCIARKLPQAIPTSYHMEAST